MGTDQKTRMDIINKIPEECISKIISFTSPRDVCRSSLVHSVFRAAADSDAVWEKILPSDCRDIISQSSSPHLYSLPKKTLFFHLCDHPVLMANDNISFSLDKHTGKKCYMVGAKGLSISWGDSPEYWQWTSILESRFPLVAKLICVWWLEVKGRIETKLLSSNTTYGVFFVFKFWRIHIAFHRPVELTVNFEGRVCESSKKVILDPPTNEPQSRMDGWMEVEMGEFFNGNGDDGSVMCRLFDYDGYIKRGLVVEGIEFRPKCSG
ncbi:hypothetical protein L6164_013272 [Bauhinia variegata]|uniref:Uncharacterized protein n=1 Tax=Bauhinia variegata TaxID=167791 RepID=A0ACB9PCI8_BAUVA|nr:hypothetical protein L6164_013272 [Bauhinia variegata]